MCLSFVAACSKAAGTDTPAPVNASLQDLLAQCTDANGAPHAEHAVRRVDLNGDRNDDFVVYAGWIECENAWSIFGDREKIVWVFAGDGHGSAREVFSDLVYDALIDAEGSSTTLWLTVAAEACGVGKAQFFADENFCERALSWRDESARFEYSPVSTVRLLR
jgi:hypothetical protein